MAILSNGLRLSDFKGSPDVIGQTIRIDDQAATIIGVMPADFQPGPAGPRMYLPFFFLQSDRVREDRTVRPDQMIVVGRLTDSVTIYQADKEIGLIANRLARQYPDTNKGWGARVVSLVDNTVQFARAAAAHSPRSGRVSVAAIACVNIANLLLVRATTRQKEISVRSRWAPAAGRSWPVRQLLCESVLLAGFGGAFGVLLAHWGMGFMISVSPINLPRIGEISIDGYALAFSSALVLLTGIGFGLVPAFQSTRVNLNEVLKDSGRGTSEGRHGQRLRSILVISEVAIALVLLVGAGLLIRSFLQFQDRDPGFQPKHLYWTPLILSGRKYPTPQSQVNFANQAIERISQLHGVDSASFTTGHFAPFGSVDRGFSIAGRPEPPRAPQPARLPLVSDVTPDYLEEPWFFRCCAVATSGLQDLATTTPVILINHELRPRLYFPGTIRSVSASPSTREAPSGNFADRGGRLSPTLVRNRGRRRQHEGY